MANDASITLTATLLPDEIANQQQLQQVIK